VNFTEDLLLWVFFYGPEGGEQTRTKIVGDTEKR
jgi:hypothetical protein